MKNSSNHMHPGMNKFAFCTFLLLVMVMPGLKDLQASGLPVSSGTQQTNEKRVTLNVKDRTLVSILSEIKNQTGLVYGFRDNRDATSNERYSINVTNVTVEEALTTLLKDSKFTFEINDGVILILTKVAQAAQQIQEEDLVTVKGRVLDEKGELRKLATPRRGYFDSQMTECGPPAVRTQAGIVLLYNGKNERGLRGDTAYAAGAYCGGQMLFDAKNPYRLIGRLDKPFFVPEAPFERSGQYVHGTVFMEGLVCHGHRLYLYYGCADSRVAVAVCEDMDKLEE